MLFPLNPVIGILADGFGVSLDITNNYYPDSTFTWAVGYTEVDCDGVHYQGGTLTNYRYHETFNCVTDADGGHCETFNPGTGTWSQVSCPNETATMYGRLRIPVGK